MANCVVRNWEGAEVGNVSLDLKVAKEENAQHIVHRAVIRQLNNSRQGNASTKTRAEVRGGGRKPWRQKGTGRARAGSNRSPLWRGGGVIFGPKPRDFNVKMNRKERRLALRTALQSRAADVIVTEGLGENLTAPKTKELVAAFTRWGIEVGSKVLVVLDDAPENVVLSARNIERVKLIRADQLNVFDLLHADAIVTTASSLEKIQEVYGE
jgi:large subunit ribosomal protein L4